MDRGGRVEHVRNRINILMKLGREHQVLKAYDEIMKLSGESDEIYFKKAVLLFRMKKMKEAAAECDRAISINSSVPIYHYGKALALNVLEDYPGSLKEINEVLRLVSAPQKQNVSEEQSPKETPSRNINNEIERLLKHFEEIESNNDLDQQMEELQGEVERVREVKISEEESTPDVEEAPETTMKRILVKDQNLLDPDFTESIDDLKKFDKALKEIDNHFNRQGGLDKQVNLAMDEKEERLKRLLLDLQDPQIEELLRMYSEVIRIDLNFEDRRNLKRINRVLETNPKNGELHYGKGLFLYTRGDLGEALTEMEIAKNLDPVSSAYTFGLTLIENKSLDYDLSIKHLTNLVLENPQSPSNHYKRGIMLYLLKRYGESADEFKKAIDLYQYDPRYYYGKVLSKYMLDSQN